MISENMQQGKIQKQALSEVSDVVWEMMDVLEQGIVILDANGRFEYVNPACADMMARPVEQIIGLSPYDIAHPDEHQKLYHIKQKRHAGESSTYKIRFKKPTGDLLYASITGWPRKNSKGFAGTCAIITDLRQKEAKDSLAQTQKHLEGVVNSTIYGVIIVDESQEILLFNHAAEALFTTSSEDALGQPLNRFISEQFHFHPQQHPQSVDSIKPIRQGLGHFGTSVALRSNGEEFPIELSISQTEADNQLLYTIFLRDITARTEMEQRLRQSEGRLLTTLDSLLEGCQIVGFDWRYLYINSVAAVQGKQENEANIGRTMMETYPGIEQTDMFGTLERCMNERVAAHMIMPFTFADGSQNWFELNIEPVPEGICILSFDITKRKEAEEKLLHSQTQLQYIIDTVPEGVLLLEATGCVTLANPLAQQYLSILAPEWENGRLTHLANLPIDQLLTSPPKGLWHEINFAQYAFETSARPVEHGPETSGWVMVLRDVTKERDIQRQVQQQQQLAAVGQLAAGIAHDFNNILAVITLYSQLILRTESVSERSKDKLITVEKQAKRATDLVQQILDFSRQSVLERQAVDMLPFLKELYKLLARTLPEHIEVELNHSGEGHIIYADPSRVQQALMNLAVNSRDALPEGGRLRMRLERVQTLKGTPLIVREMPPGDWVKIEVCDNGIGIPQNVLPHIFEPFFTTKEVGKGTGLGLAQVYGIVLQHDGYIDIKTDIGSGTTFVLYFPSYVTDEETAVRVDSDSLQYGQNQVVLLVEDDYATRQALVDSLMLLNYWVIEAKNGREALAILATKADEIDLIISDVVMPVMGGIALLHTLQQQKLTIPVMLLTGHPLSQEMANLETLGLAGWLPKPPGLTALSQLIAEILSQNS